LSDESGYLENTNKQPEALIQNGLGLINETTVVRDEINDESDIPGFTIILLCRDRQEYAQKAFDSVLRQTKAPLEVIVSDNSRHSPIRLVGSIKNGLTQRYIRQSGDLSAKLHMRVAALAVRTSHFMFLHDDDELQEKYVEKITSFFDFDSRFSAVGTNALLINGQNTGDIKFPNASFVEADETITHPNDLLIRYTSSKSAGVPPFSSFAYRTKDFILTPFTALDTEYYDAIFLIEILEKGPMYLMREKLFKLRVHAERITSRCSVKDYKIFYNWAKRIIQTEADKNALHSYRFANFKAQFLAKSNGRTMSRTLLFAAIYLNNIRFNPEVRHRTLRFICGKLNIKPTTV
jgi:glycosyltransferase involved in cell wall biosynthesis